MAIELEHTADLGFRVSARSLDRVFEDAGVALTNLILDTHLIMRKESRKITLSSMTREDLMFVWLSELIYLFDAEHVAFSEFVATIVNAGRVGFRLEAFVSGERIDPQRHQIRSYIKGITLHQLQVAQDADEWYAEVYVDM